MFISSTTSYDNLPASEYSVISWMHDQFTDNVGHRRAIINPFVKSISFGRVDGSPVGKTWIGSAMSLKFMDNLNQIVSDMDIEYVAHPYENYPPVLFDNDWYLSFSVVYNKSTWWNNRNVDFSSAVIEMKDINNNNVPVNSIIYDLDGWGAMPNCLKWRVGTLQQGMKYFVTIKNIKVNNQDKEYSYWFNLTDPVVEAPAVPLLSSPANNSKDQEPALTLEWNSAENAESYDLQFSNDIYFSNKIVDEEKLTALSYDLSGLEPGQKYYWRVRSVNSARNSDWSKIWTFETKAPLPAMAQLYYPGDQGTDISRLPLLVWRKLSNDVSYHVQLSNSDLFGSSGLFVDEENVTDTAHAVPGNMKLRAFEKYYWRVRASGISGPGDWSDIWSFTTGDHVAVNEISDHNFTLHIYPNPTVNKASIDYYLVSGSYVSIALYDFAGREIKTIVNEFNETGNYSVHFDSENLSAGYYLLIFKTDNSKSTKIIEIIH